MSPRVQWLVGFAIIVAGGVLYFSTSNSLVRMLAPIVWISGMGIAVSARKRPLVRKNFSGGDARDAGPIFPQLGFVNKPIFWNVVCALLIAVGLIGIATSLLPLGAAIPALLAGATIFVGTLQQRGLRLPKVPSLVVWGIVAVLLVLFFYWRSNVYTCIDRQWHSFATPFKNKNLAMVRTAKRSEPGV